MRLSASASLLLHAAGTSVSEVAAVSTAFSLLTFVTALLLLLGLWTPVAGVLVAVAAAWHGLSIPSELRFDVLLGILGVALALVGPGAWSADARLFGWKRLEIQNGTGKDTTPSNSRDDSSSV